jgi:hypothetical protein
MFEKPEEMTQAEYDELKANNWIKKWIKKVVDKSQPLWYNKDRKKERK